MLNLSQLFQENLKDVWVLSALEQGLNIYGSLPSDGAKDVFEEDACEGPEAHWTHFFLDRLGSQKLIPIANWAPEQTDKVAADWDVENALTDQDESHFWDRSQWLEPKFENFIQQIELARPLLEADKIRKWVPYVEYLHSQCPSLEQFQRILGRLLRIQQKSGGTIVGRWSKASGFIGLSPERLFELNDKCLKTHALAGTNWKGKGISLFDDPKEILEHELVVQDLKEKLAFWGEVREGPRQVVAYGRLEHLMTPLEVNCQIRPNITQVIRRLHPTPALGGYPSKKVFQWMQSLEVQKDRGLYGAPITLQISKEIVYSIVMIRSLFWENGKSRIPVGCGYLKSSNPDREWSELEQKFLATFQMLGGNE